jgi:hypothetical protein
MNQVHTTAENERRARAYAVPSFWMRERGRRAYAVPPVWVSQGRPAKSGKE